MVHLYDMALYRYYNYVFEKYLGMYRNVLGIILNKRLGHKTMYKASFYA